MYEGNAQSGAIKPLIAEAVSWVVSLARCAVCSQCLCTWPLLQGNIAKRLMFAAEGLDPSVKRICRVQGIAVCWSPDAVYYIPLNPAAPGADKLVAGMMANKRAQKITFDLKSQMAALLSGTLHHTSTLLYSTVLYCSELHCTVLYSNKSHNAEHSDVSPDLLHIIVDSAGLRETSLLSCPDCTYSTIYVFAASAVWYSSCYSICVLKLTVLAWM